VWPESEGSLCPSPSSRSSSNAHAGVGDTPTKSTASSAANVSKNAVVNDILVGNSNAIGICNDILGFGGCLCVGDMGVSVQTPSARACFYNAHNEINTNRRFCAVGMIVFRLDLAKTTQPPRFINGPHILNTRA
jgi:hypothetical protein